MIKLKTLQGIQSLRQAGRTLAQVLDAVIAAAKPGVTTKTLDELAERLIREAGAKPAFLGYRGGDHKPFPSTLCASVNDTVVHAPASEEQLREGDIVGLDLGLAQKFGERWLYVDMAKTVPVGTVSRTARRLMTVTEEALAEGIAQVAPGKMISDISRAVQRRIEAAGYSVVRQLVGHGVGYAVHEEPRVPNYIDKDFEEYELQPGLVIAIEPMANVGHWRVNVLSDGWKIVTTDGSLSAHFEHTVAVTEGGHEILTR